MRAAVNPDCGPSGGCLLRAVSAGRSMRVSRSRRVHAPAGVVMSRCCVSLLVIVVVGVAFAIGDDRKPDELITDLPKTKPLEPGESAKAFDIRPGFRIELVASEPLIRSPVALDFDENGRLFVVEFPEYNQYANPNPPKVRGCVKMLEDTDGDGKYDK